MLTKFRALSLLAVSALVCLFAASLQPDTIAAQEGAPAPTPTPVVELDQYSGVDIHAGVWNDGQAALWDLNVIDFFRIFGAESRARGYRPEQPINFSHVVHVQKNKMECQYCHWSVSKAAYAAIPEVETCMGCHKIVKTDSPEIKKLKSYYDKGEPVPWVKVHVMPDHVFFNHKRHVKAGVSCHECHGQVPRMPVVERVSSMKMGWCIDCHRQKGTNIDCYTCHK
jgi:hypothetical protein